jgi:signal transduction histidine kinase
VLRNLLSNAIRHTPADGVVSVQVGTDDRSAFVEVVDGCGGIPPDDLPRVFDVAFRGTTARTPGDDGGAGLGLAIARGLVEAHRGEITIGNHGSGCRVLVRLPASREPVLPQPARR